MSDSGVDPTTPSPARMYDLFLGGKDNFAVDRAAVSEVLRVAPSVRKVARDNRRFMVRAVRYCARAGVRQFVDIGTGIPTPPNVCEVARSERPDALVVGVDNDPQVLAHGRCYLDGVHIIDGDVRSPAGIIDDPLLNRWIDWSQPVAVLFIAVLHFVTDAQDPSGIVATFRERMAPGSLVVISHVSSTGADPAEVAAVERVYQRASSPGVSRTHEEILSLFDGFEFVAPGLVPVQRWGKRPGKETAIPILGGVGRIPGVRVAEAI